jgi:DNA-binding NarL/FixJ family response regulator
MKGRMKLALVVRHRLFRDVLTRWLAESAGDVEVVAAVASVDELRVGPGWGADAVVVEPSCSTNAQLAEELTALVCTGSRVIMLCDDPDPVTARVGARAGVAVQLGRSARGEELLAALRARPVSASAS